MRNVSCIHCDHLIPVTDDLKVSEILTCSDCGEQLEIVSIAPIQAIAAPAIEEDWGE